MTLDEILTKFQFQKGAIKRSGVCVATKGKTGFQFQKGAIKRISTFSS